MQKVAKSKSLEKKHRIVNQHIYQEYFYFNPIYRKMISKVTQVLTREGLDQQRASRFLLTLPNTEMVVKYRKHRQNVSNWTSNGGDEEQTESRENNKRDNEAKINV